VISFLEDIDAKYAQIRTIKHSHQLFVIDLELTLSFKAPTLINDWIQLYNIDLLYIIAPFTYEYLNIDRIMTSVRYPLQNIYNFVLEST